MKEMKEIFENINIDAWIQHFLRSKKQLNKPHETDAELIEIPGLQDHYLAVTIDTVAEEITMGLYQDPYTMGWVTIMASMSDLAAVGAEPLGMVISTSVSSSQNQKFSSGIAQGIEDACRNLEVFILGGDTNITPITSLTCCAFGLVPREKVITRLGCKPGEDIYITGYVGMGNALGLVRLTKLPSEYFPEKIYRPAARIKEGLIIRKYASCCMDTSDGLLTTLDQLMRLNGLGFIIDCHWEEILAPKVLDLCRKTKTPPWLMLAGPHGEFELVFTSEPNMANDTHENKNFIKIGKVQQTPTLSLILPSGSNINIDMAPIRNLLQTVRGDLEQYVKEFRAIGKELGLE